MNKVSSYTLVQYREERLCVFLAEINVSGNK